MRNNIDFGIDYSFGDTSPLIYTLDRDSERYIRCFDHSFNRIIGALTFISEVGRASDIHISESYLKASLGELISVEDAIKEDSKNLNISKSPFKLHNSDHPLFHILKEIRNYQFHLRPAEFKNRTKRVTWASNRDKDKKEIEYFEHSFLVISNFGKSEFRNLSNSKYYDEQTIEQLINWFENSQNQWGICDLIWRGINLLVTHIINYYDLKTVSEAQIEKTIEEIKTGRVPNNMPLNVDSFESLLRYYFASEDQRIDENLLLVHYEELVSFGFSFKDINSVSKWFEKNRAQITKNLKDADFHIPEEKHLPFIHLSAVLNIVDDNVFESGKKNLIPEFKKAIQVSRENITPYNRVGSSTPD